MMFTVAILCVLFLKEHPRDVGLEGYNDDSRSLTTKMISDEGEDNVTTEVDATIDDVKSKKPSMSICEGLWIGIRIPGVLEFSLCLMFAKCVAYTFIYWTPYYLAHNGFTTSEAVIMLCGCWWYIRWYCCRTSFGSTEDVRPCCSREFDPVSSRSLIFHELSSSIGDSSVFLNILLMLMVGSLVNGPYALITTAVSRIWDSINRLKEMPL